MEGIPERNHLLATIEGSAAGLSVAELIKIHPSIPRRTAQRWVSRWVEQGFIASSGEGRGRCYMSYRYADGAGVAVADPGSVYETDAHIPVSADARDIVEFLRRPWVERNVRNYQQSFLEDYTPNVTRYLSASLCHQLHKMGAPTPADSPSGSLVNDILGRLLIDLSWASSYLEGNTYSLPETARLIEKNMSVEGKSVTDAQMILNHKSAIELIVNNVDDMGFNRYSIMNLHSALAYGLLDEDQDEGRVRSRAVAIGQSNYRPLAFPAQLDEMLDRFLDKADSIDDPFEQSFFALVHLPYLQPFIDVNKRTSRLVANIPLIKHNLCPITFMGISKRAYTQAVLGVYELNRIELLRDVFVAAYSRSVGEYFTLKRDLVAPDPRRLMYRDLIRQTIIDIIRNVQRDSLEVIDQSITGQVPAVDRADVRAIIIRELSVLHDGKLARYGLLRSEFSAWKAQQSVSL